MKFGLTVCFLFFIFIFCFAGIDKKDSLLIELGKTQSDTGKISILIQLNDLYYLEGNFEKARNYCEEAVKLYHSSGDKKGISGMYNNIGNSFSEEGKYALSLEYYLKSLNIRESINDEKGMAASYNNIGILYLDQSNFSESIVYLKKSLAIREKLDDKKGIASSYNNIGNVYSRQKNFNSAIENYQMALKSRLENGDKLGASETHNNLGAAYDEIRNFDLALKHYLESIKLKEEIGDEEGLAYSYINIGEYYTTQHIFGLAEEYLIKSISLARKFNAKDLLMAAYNSLAVCYEAKNDFRNAYLNHVLYAQTKDSLFNEESSRQIAEMKTKYETEKKEQQITLLSKDKELQDAQLNRQKIIIWSVAGGLFVVLVLSAFIFRERKKSEKLLLNILPAEIARELKQSGKATAKHYESVTVMFTDFKGFTGIAEKLSAEELVSELDFLFRKFDEIISKYSIEKIKTIGDAYMCASGLPTPNTDHAENILKAALEIQAWMQSQKSMSVVSRAEPWQLRIGIHSGPVTAGIVGDKKFAYDIWGDAVNTASRMESSGEPDKINISGATYELIKEKFACEFRGKVPAKNKGEIEMYFVNSPQ